MQLIIRSNKSDLILPMRIVKPSGQSHADRISYAVETPLGWAVTNWLPSNKRWHHHRMRLKCMKEVQAKKRSCSGCLLFSRRYSRTLAVMEQTAKKLEGEDAYVSGLLWRED